MKLKLRPINLLSKLKTIIKFVVYFMIDILIDPSKDIKPKSILLIRLDAIGDYVLFRNFIGVLKKSAKYEDYTVTLLGNSEWRSPSEHLDDKYIDRFIWLDRKEFAKDLVYRYKMLREIASSSYEIVLSPVYSREFAYGDSIVKLVNAKEKVGSVGDLSNIKKWQKNISDKYYDVLVPANNEIMFEFDRNREFFENFLDTRLDIKKPYIALEPRALDFKLPQRYAILFIGASASFRKWDIKKFVKIGEYLKENYDYEIFLCGGPSEIEEAEEFKEYFKYDYIDLVGKTSLIELLRVIDGGELMVSNETSAPHFAVALEMANIFAISNGNHYGRFTPYPKRIASNCYTIYHPQIEKDRSNYKKLSNSYGSGSRLDINEISINTVKKKINKVLR